MYGDLKKDLIINLVTNFILSEDIYMLIHNLYSTSEEMKLLKLNALFNNEHALKTLLNFEALKIKQQFRMDASFW